MTVRNAARKLKKGTVLDRLAAFIKDNKGELEELEKEDTQDDVSCGAESDKGLGEIHIHLGGGPEGNSGGAAEVTKDEELGAEGEGAGDPVAQVQKDLKELKTIVGTLAIAVQKIVKGSAEAEEVDEDPDAIAEDEMKEEAPAIEDPSEVRDSAPFQDSFRDTVAMAEIIVPGVSIPTFDGAAKPRKTLDALCSFRRTVLDLAWTQPATRGMMETLNGGRTVDTKCMTCDKIRGMFRSLGALRRQSNNDRGHAATHQVAGGGQTQKRVIRTPADLNAYNAERYGKKTA